MNTMSSINKPMNWRSGALTGWLLVSLGLPAADTLTIKTEKGPSPSGPWTAIQPAQTNRDANGNPVLMASEQQAYFRARIERAAANPANSPVGVANIPSNIVNLAESHLEEFTSPLGTNGLPTDRELWSGVKLGPEARPVYEPTILNGAAPAYWEFKVVVANPISARSRGGFITRAANPTTVTDTQSGYILVSTTEADSPIAEFATEGRSPLDELADQAGTTDFKAYRFGSTFYTAEDAEGNVLATHGTQPYKLDQLPDASQVRFSGSGDTEAGRTNLPVFPVLTASGFKNYQEFRQDYVNHPLFQQLRSQRTARANSGWGIERGITLHPQVIVRVGASISETNRSAVRKVSLEAEDPDIAQVSINARTPTELRITGAKVGTGTIVIVDAAGTNYLTLSVMATIRSASDGFTPGWRTKKIYYAGSWDTQPKFYQLKRDEFCDYVGCGPVAWGMLLAWFEVNKNVPGAFGDFATTDVSLSMNEYSKSYIDTWRALHSACGTWCVPFSDEAATYPGAMVDGGPTYLYMRYAMGIVHYKWSSEYNFWSSGTYAMHCRDAIVNGYPAIVGLGWLWHYALAYGVAYQEMEMMPGMFVGSRRILKCNMGWGPNSSPRWYDMDDTFLGIDFNIWKGPNANLFNQ